MKLAFDRGLESLRLVLEQPEPLRDGVLRWGCALFLLAVYLLGPWLTLRDRAATPEPSPEPPPDAPGWIGAAYALALAALVAAFPLAFPRGLHLLLAPAALALTLAAGSAGSPRLSMQRPRALRRAECLALLGLGATVAVLTLWRWKEMPVGLHGDEAKCGLTALQLFRDGRHPFFLNEAGVPAFLQSLDGLAFLWIDDRVLALRMVPLLCAVMAPLVLFRWLRLIGPPALAWLASLALVGMPFFEHYSRTPTGTTLVLAQLLFLYGLTRSLVAPGALGPLLGGLGLGIAQWDYYASRMLIGLVALAPILLAPYARQLAAGWWKRVALLGLVAVPIASCFVLMSNYSSHGWTFYLLPRSDPLPPSDTPLVLALWKRLALHAPMWFSDEGNKVGAITVPGSPVLPFPQGALALVGAGVLIASALRAPAALVASMLLLGLVPSLVTDGPPNGHRVLTAEIPVAVLLGLGLHALWPGAANGPRGASRMRRGLAVAALLASSVAGLAYFHGHMRQSGGYAWSQEIAANLRARRLLDEGARFDRRLVTPIHPVERFLLDEVELPVLNFGHWLPTNWSRRPLSVNSLVERQALVGLARSALRPGDWEEYVAVDGEAAGWRYRTDGQPLGAAAVAEQWRAQRAIRGTWMLPSAGIVELRCPGYRVAYRTPLLSASVDGDGRFRVHRGLAEVRIEPLHGRELPPEAIDIAYTPDGAPTENHRLQPGDLFAIPVHGWLRQTFAAGDAGETRIESAILPTLFAWWGVEEEWPKPTSERRRTVYSALVAVPEGVHPFLAYVTPPRQLWIRVGGRDVVRVTPDEAREAHEFSLDARHHGQLIEISRLDDGGTHEVSRFSLQTRLPNGHDEVPPYAWFVPAAPR